MRYLKYIGVKKHFYSITNAFVVINQGISPWSNGKLVMQTSNLVDKP